MAGSIGGSEGRFGAELQMDGGGGLAQQRKDKAYRTGSGLARRLGLIWTYSALLPHPVDDHLGWWRADPLPWAVVRLDGC
jgi:hypothetical protein